MDKREKVLKGLECCQYSSKSRCDDCPYDYENMCSILDCTSDLAIDALELVTEQEAVEPEAETLNEIDRIYRCPKCHKAFFYENQKYCDHCGQKVKWNA